jgi:hypothetical protein
MKRLKCPQSFQIQKDVEEFNSMLEIWTNHVPSVQKIDRGLGSRSILPVGVYGKGFTRIVLCGLFIVEFCKVRKSSMLMRQAPSTVPFNSVHHCRR